MSTAAHQRLNMSPTRRLNRAAELPRKRLFMFSHSSFIHSTFNIVLPLCFRRLSACLSPYPYCPLHMLYALCLIEVVEAISDWTDDTLRETCHRPNQSKIR